MTTNTLAAARSRRDFLKSAGTVTAVALTIGFDWGSSTRRAFAAALPSATFTPNAFLRIGSDNSVTVIAKHVEMGQGAYTGIATIVAEELDADWAQVRVESAPADAKRYANLVFGRQDEDENNNGSHAFARNGNGFSCCHIDDGATGSAGNQCPSNKTEGSMRHLRRSRRSLRGCP